MTERDQFTYKELRTRAERCAEQLQRLPTWRPGHRVGVRLENSADYIAAFYGTLLAKGVVVPLPVVQTETWVDHVLESTEACGVWEKDAFCLRRWGHAPPVDVDAQLAAIFFTSGTSGDPKGVMLSHANLLANARSIRRALPIRTTDRALALLPFCHAFGNSVMQTHLLNGAALIVAGSSAFPESLMNAMQRFEVTAFYGVPDLFRVAFHGDERIRAALPELRYAAIAGGALPPGLAGELTARLEPAEFYVMYGQTEATARLSILSPSEATGRCGSIGRGISDVTLQVVNESGQLAGPHRLGEIRAKGPNVMMGYWNDPAATSQVIREGWLHTGDLAVCDDEGFIYPHGRMSQLIKIAGHRLHPREVESVIAAEFPMFDPIVVSFETIAGGSRLALFLVPLRAHAPRNPKRVHECCAQHLARFQRPDYIAYLEHPPLTPSLKADRLALSRMAAEATQRSPSPVS
ncbi:MAG TPA: class I adenylate-forming enzyme family protein [Planctomycetaceae bacterium]|nr:class I adenylate-forming enzyme family protein [Planctomycetaceae bacterium]